MILFLTYNSNARRLSCGSSTLSINVLYYLLMFYIIYLYSNVHFGFRSMTTVAAIATSILSNLQNPKIRNNYSTKCLIINSLTSILIFDFAKTNAWLPTRCEGYF